MPGFYSLLAFWIGGAGAIYTPPTPGGGRRRMLMGVGK